MTLDEAYQKLGLQDPLKYEADVLAQVGSTLVARVGTTTRMLVMAALDLVEDRSVLVLMSSKDDKREGRARLLKLAGDMGITMRQVQRLEMGLVAEYANKARTDPALVVYTDHWRDPLSGDDRRVLGPLGLARWYMQDITLPDGYEVYDRDNRTLATVTRKGLEALQARHFVAVSPWQGGMM